MKHLFQILVTSFFAAFPAALFACSCMMSGPPCQAYWNSPVIFSGRVLEAEKFLERRGYEQRSIKFGVIETFRGEPGRIVDVITGRGGGDCGYNFEVGKNYLVYAYKRSDGQLGAGICSRTNLLSEAEEDLAYFRGLSTSKPLGLIYGAVTEHKPRKQDAEWEPNKPFPNVAITIDSEGRRMESRSDEKGEFRFPDISPGDYVLKMIPPKGYFPFESEQKIKVIGKGCSVIGNSFTRDTSVSGRVTDEHGLPLSALAVSLVPVDQIDARYQKDYQWTYIDKDKDGRFTFRSIPPGNYYLGFRLDRITNRESAYPRTFYPGTTSLDEAGIITVQTGEVLENLDFQLPPKLDSRRIAGVIVFPDGKPVPNASLQIKESATGADAGCKGKVDPKSGKFEYSCLEGMAYSASAYATLPNGDQKHAEPILIPASGPVNKIKLVISEAGGSCSKCRGN